MAPSLRLVLGAVERDQRASTSSCCASRPISAGASTSFTFATARVTPLPAQRAGSAVAQLDRFALAGRRSRGNGRGARGAAGEGHHRLDGGKAARVENLACVDAFDLRHCSLLARGLGGPGQRAQDHDPDLGQQRQHRDDALDAQPGAGRLRRQFLPRQPGAALARCDRACAAPRAGSSSRCRDGRWWRSRGRAPARPACAARVAACRAAGAS